MGSPGELYEIRIDGNIGPDWADWFDDMQVRQEADGQTVIAGRVRDQSALRGLLARIGDLNLNLISVNCVDETQGIPVPPNKKENT